MLLVLPWLLHRVHYVSHCFHQLSLSSVILVASNFDARSNLLGLAFLLLLIGSASLLAVLLVEKHWIMVHLLILMIDRLKLADLLLRLRSSNLLLLKHLKLLLFVTKLLTKLSFEKTSLLWLVATEFLTFNNFLLNDLCHLNWHTIDTLSIPFDVSLLLLIVTCRAEYVADMLSGLNLGLGISDCFKFFFKVINLYRILLFIYLHLLAVLGIHIVLQLLARLGLLHAVILLPYRVCVALHLIVANLFLVVWVFVILNALDVDKLLDVALLRLKLLVIRLGARRSVPH